MQENKGRRNNLPHTMKCSLIMSYYDDIDVADNVAAMTMKISQM